MYVKDIMKTNEEKRAFYARCAQILDIEHVWNEPVPRRTRWNTRRLGNGRYPGFGLIQCYGTTVRVVSRRGTRMFDSYEAVYEYLQIVLDKPV
jgi:hypothetical protein